MDDGNASQTRLIIEQVADVLDERRARRELNASYERPKSSGLLGSIPAWIAMAIAIGSLVYTFGVQGNTIANNSARLDKLDGLAIDRSLARLEAKVDLLIEERKDGK